MLKKRSDARRNSSNSAGPMADIAFLLLIFFLLATTIPEEQGIMTRLPPWDEHPIPAQVSAERVLSVKLNAQGKLLVKGLPCSLLELAHAVHKHLEHQGPRAILSLQHDRGTAYSDFLQVYDTVLEAYRKFWNLQALQLYQKHWKDLNTEQQATIRRAHPLVISEAEPSDFAEK